MTAIPESPRKWRTSIRLRADKADLAIRSGKMKEMMIPIEVELDDGSQKNDRQRPATEARNNHGRAGNP